MVVEQVDVTLRPGHEDDYLSAMYEVRDLLSAAKGCRAVSFGRNIENPSTATLLLYWDSVQCHEAFTSTAEHAIMVAKAGPFVASATVQHFFCHWTSLTI